MAHAQNYLNWKVISHPDISTYNPCIPKNLYLLVVVKKLVTSKLIMVLDMSVTTLLLHLQETVSLQNSCECVYVTVSHMHKVKKYKCINVRVPSLYP